MAERKPELDPARRWRCDDCYESFDESEFLRAPSPFDPEDEITGCPRCKSTDDFTPLCDHGSCTRQGSGGYPMANGSYVLRCFEHRPYDVHDKSRTPRDLTTHTQPGGLGDD